VKRLDRFQKRDLLLLAACYDNSLTATFQSRWYRLRRKLRLHQWQHWAFWLLGAAVTATTIGLIVYYREFELLKRYWIWLIIAAGWLPLVARAARWWFQARRVAKNLRCVNRDVHPLRRVLMQFSGRDINGQPLPAKDRTDDRYELLYKFQGVLKTLGFSGIVVLVDRVDEPHLMNGSLENMKGLVWSMLDNKFLKQPGMGMKLLLPIELSDYVNREGRDFYQRARLDKQNMVPSLQWTGQSLYDLANARVKACGAKGATPQMRDLFADDVTDSRLVEAFASLRVPRHLFKFLYRILAAHCQQHVDSEPQWKVSVGTFDTQLALYRHEQQALDRVLAG
jgi:hypothetical protein